MFHRFTKDPASRIDCRGVVNGAFLDRLLRHIRRSGLPIVPLRDVPKLVEAGQKFVCLTMDDGYRDNMEIALPILRSHNAPATIFVPSGILDRTIDAWWLQIEELARKQRKPRRFYRKKIAELTQDPEALARARRYFPAGQRELNDRYFMSAEEIKALAADPLIDIGGHTVTHPFLKRLPEEAAWQEIRQNKEDLEALLDRPVDTFAYPFGDARACGAREYKLAKKAGYKVAVTTQDGNVFGRHAANMMALPRCTVHAEPESVEIYEMQRSGIYNLLKSGFRPALAAE
ncbi:MAG TPA: polysaccharide deacetylase family protein [Patescibacteria group bacterium]|nr:polysaccharide deacetylase family protein [Patescibacteria group bacterium]